MLPPSRSSCLHHARAEMAEAATVMDDGWAVRTEGRGGWEEGLGGRSGGGDGDGGGREGGEWEGERRGNEGTGRVAISNVQE